LTRRPVARGRAPTATRPQRVRTRRAEQGPAPSRRPAGRRTREGRSRFSLVVDDGFFALNGGAFEGDHGAVSYFAPDSLRWEPLEPGYADFVHWALTGDVDGFYADLRWPGWQDEVRPLGLDDGLLLYPPPFTAEGRPVAAASRRPVPLTELWRLQRDYARQVAAAAPGTPVEVTVGDTAGAEPPSLREQAAHFSDVARRLLVEDGEHDTIALLRHPDGRFHPVPLEIDADDRDRAWAALAARAAETRADAVIVIGEAWIASVDDRAPSPGQSYQARDVLVVGAVGAAGGVVTFESPFVRGEGGEIRLEPARESADTAWPSLDAVRDVWSRRP
jgi:hypothetical protein